MPYSCQTEQTAKLAAASVNFGRLGRVLAPSGASGDHQFSDAALLSNLAICLAHEKIAAIFIVLLPLRALHLQPVAFARFVRRVFSLGHDALEPALAAFSE
jgi:hypothetical protein